MTLPTKHSHLPRASSIERRRIANRRRELSGYSERIFDARYNQRYRLSPIA